MKPEVRTMVDALRHHARQLDASFGSAVCMMNAADMLVLMDCRMQDARDHIMRGMSAETATELLEKSVDASEKE